MAIEPVPPISPAPTPGPQRGDQSTFDDRMDASIRWQEIAAGMFNTLAYNVENNAQFAYQYSLNAKTDQQLSSQSAAIANEKAGVATQYAIQSQQDAERAKTFSLQAAQSAASAAAVTGLPDPAGKANFKMVVNAQGTAYVLMQDSNNLGYVPIQTGTGPGQQAGSAISIGRTPDYWWGLKVSVDNTDLGWFAVSSTPTNVRHTFPSPVQAPSFDGAHMGDASQLSGLTGNQIRTALGYIPASDARFNYGGVLEMGRYQDFHYYPDSQNDYDVRFEVSEPVVGQSGTSTFTITTPKVRIFYNGGWGDLQCNWLTAAYFIGNGSNITGMTRTQITNALGYTPPNQTDAEVSGRMVVSSRASNFDQLSQDTLRVSQPSGDASHSAHMEFVREGRYGIKVGLDANNSFCFGGYSQGQNVMRFYSSSAGDAVAMGNVTAYSDIRFKTQISDIGHVVKKILQLELGGFQYLDHNTGQFKYGVSAQDVRKLFPYSVVEDAKGYLSVAYGQLALPLLIEVTRDFDARFSAQQAEIDELKAQIKTLLSKIN